MANYSLISFLSSSGQEIPVGLAWWDEGKRLVELKIISSLQKPFDMSDKDYMLLTFAYDKINSWLNSNSYLPYATSSFLSWTNGYWEHIRSLFIHQVRLSEPMETGFDMELLFDSLVDISP